MTAVVPNFVLLGVGLVVLDEVVPSGFMILKYMILMIPVLSTNTSCLDELGLLLQLLLQKVQLAAEAGSLELQVVDAKLKVLNLIRIHAKTSELGSFNFVSRFCAYVIDVSNFCSRVLHSVRSLADEADDSSSRRCVSAAWALSSYSSRSHA